MQKLASILLETIAWFFLPLLTTANDGPALCFHKGAPDPPKPPKIKMPKMPKMPKLKIPHVEIPPAAPPPPTPPNQTMTSDVGQAQQDAVVGALRRKGQRSTLFAGEGAYQGSLGGGSAGEGSQGGQKTLG